MFDESFWVLVSFSIFIGFTYKPIKVAILKMLDEKAAKILHNLEEAAKIKAEAEALLLEIQMQYQNIQKNAKEILEKASTEAQIILENAEKEALRITKKRTELAMQRIAQEEEQIIRDIKSEAVESALAAVQQMIVDELDKSSKLGLIDDSIKSLKKFVH